MFVNLIYIHKVFNIFFRQRQINQDANEKRIVTQQYFNVKERNKKTFLATIDLFKEKEKHLRGYVEFIYASLKHMKDFGVERELEGYIY